MNFKICGHCGQLLDEDCNPLYIEECKKITTEQLNNAELDYGICCYGEELSDYAINSKSMATDE